MQSDQAAAENLEPTIVGFTVVARNYLAHARVLAESLARSNPDTTFYVFVLDDDGSGSLGNEPFEVLGPLDVFQQTEFETLVSIYSVMELATAVKPRVLRYLLDRTDGPVAYLDPDLWFFESLDHVANLATEHGIVLTPHAVSAIERDGRRPAETEILKSGIYNLGFVAVGQTARPFLDWWWERLERDCIVAPEDGVFVDQKWVDFVPGLFDHYILKDPGYNLAYWNLGEREIEWSDGGYSVDGHPLVFAHFSGFDPTKPHVLSKHTLPSPRVLMSEEPVLAKLAGEYAEAMLDAGYVEAQSATYRLDVLPNGIRYDRIMRSLYRSALLDFEDPDVDDAPEPPNPFTEPDVFVDWLREPADPKNPRTVSRYLYGLWNARADLQVAYGDPLRTDPSGYVRWVVDYGRKEEKIPAVLLPDLNDLDDTRAPRTSDTTPASGVNVTGYLRAELGVGEASRQMAETVRLAGEPLAMLSYSGTDARENHPVGDVLDAGIDVPPFDVNIVTINADSTVQFAADVGAPFFRDRYTIGMWAWEVEEFPEAWSPAFDVVDEVWMNSQYATDIVAEVAPIPVFNFPLAVSSRQIEPLDKADLGLPDRFMFLFSFDFFSVYQRKNPEAVVEAFKRAFPDENGPILMIKSINGDKRIEHLEALKMAAADRSDIFLFDGYLPADQKNRLMATCDAYVSLHRSEGFGLTMAEAMAQGKPTIATNYSGNLDFMDPSNSFLVDYSMTTVPKGCDPYPVGAAWAEPSVGHAAQLMREVFDDQPEALRIGAVAKQTIEADHSPQARVELFKSHIERIRSDRSYWRKRDSSASRGLVGVPHALSAARVAVERPVENRWLGDGSGGIRDTLRSGALAAVRPAIARGRAIDESLLSVSEQLWQHVQTLESSLLKTSAALAALDEKMDDNVAAIAKLSATHEQAITELGERLSSELGAVKRVSGDLAQQVSALETWSASTNEEINAVPYMADPDMYASHDGVLRFAGGLDGAVYRDFEDVFRGDEKTIQDRQRVYLPLVESSDPVLDAGSGRGEFLELLAGAGIEAVGVDLDEDMAARSRDKGLDVVHGDVLTYLADSPDDRFGAIFSAQMIEHLDLEQLIEFLMLSRRKLRAGGVFIAETVNPHSFRAFRTFWTDLSHRAPIFPEVALTLVRSAGFESGYVMHPNGSGDFSEDSRACGEYSVVAYA